MRSIRVPTLLVVTMLTCVAKAAEGLPDALEAGWKGEAVCERLHEDDELRILRCTFAPGVGHERHYHPPHVGYAIAGGRMRVTDIHGTREIDVPTGIAFDNPEGIEWHEALNVGDETSVFLMIEPKQGTRAVAMPPAGDGAARVE